MIPIYKIEDIVEYDTYSLSEPIYPEIKSNKQMYMKNRIYYNLYKDNTIFYISIPNITSIAVDSSGRCKFQLDTSSLQNFYNQLLLILNEITPASIQPHSEENTIETYIGKPSILELNGKIASLNDVRNMCYKNNRKLSIIVQIVIYHQIIKDICYFENKIISLSDSIEEKSKATILDGQESNNTPEDTNYETIDEKCERLNIDRNTIGESMYDNESGLTITPIQRMPLEQLLRFMYEE